MLIYVTNIHGFFLFFFFFSKANLLIPKIVSSFIVKNEQNQTKAKKPVNPEELLFFMAHLMQIFHVVLFPLGGAIFPVYSQCLPSTLELLACFISILCNLFCF